MKKTLFFLVLVMGISLSTYAQSAEGSDLTPAQLVERNASNTKWVNDVMVKLATLNLSDAQKTTVRGAVLEFITNKRNIKIRTPEDKMTCSSKINGFRTTMLGKIQGSLTTDQYKNYLALKPRNASIAYNEAYSQLFY